MPDRDKPTIRVVHHLARTGGTVLSKCLASMAGIALLSEIHPNGPALVAKRDPSYAPAYSPIAQARSWLGLLNADEAGLMAMATPSTSFADTIATIARRAEATGTHLVIRDWSHIDFTGVPFEPHPPLRFRTIESLNEFPLLRVCTVRHPAHQWLSLAKVPGIEGHITLQEYAKSVRLFAQHAVAIGFVRYEDFCAEPEAHLRRLCQALRLLYDDGWRERWATYDKITGDNRAIHRARAIEPPASSTIPRPLLDAFASNADYRLTLSLLGYTHPA